MARAGRPRKPGKRKPCGRRRNSEVRADGKRNDVRSVVFEQPHRRWLADARRRDQQAESEIGRLRLSGLISEAEYWAAERFRSIVAQFRVVLATPMQTCTALGLVVANPVDEDAWKRGESGTAERPESEEDMRKRVLQQHGRMLDVLRALPDGRDISRVIEAVVINNSSCSNRHILVSRQDPHTGANVPERCIPNGELALLKCGLAALCEVWHLDVSAPSHAWAPSMAERRVQRGSWGRAEKEVHIVYTDD